MKKLSLFLIIVGLVCFVACKKEKDDPKPKEPITAQKAMEALKEFAQSNGQFDATVKESGNIVDETGLTPGKKSHGRGYPVVSCEAQGDGTWLVTCDYGPTLIPCDDGHFRRGIIKIVTTGFFSTPGTVMTVTFDDFYQKGDWLALEYKVDGTQVITHLSSNLVEDYLYSVTVTDGMITYNTKQIHYSEATIRALSPSAELCENQWYITGEWNGISSDEVPYTLTANSTTPLHYRVCCHYFQDGILNVDVEGLQPFSIDYGYVEEEADCEQYAQINYPGLSPITFKM